MTARLAADLVLVIHLAFIVWAVFGGLAVLWRGGMLWRWRGGCGLNSRMASAR